MTIPNEDILKKLKTLFNKWVMALQATLLPESPFWAASFVNREFSHCEAASALARRDRGNPCIFLRDKTGWTLLVIYPSPSNSLKYRDRPAASRLPMAALFLSIKPP